MAQTSTVRGVATSIRTTEDGWTHIRYHNTDVVSFNEHRIILRTGGWKTVTTKLRMNQAARQFKLGYGVSQKNHQWYFAKYYGEGNWGPDQAFEGDTVSFYREKEGA